MVVSPIPTFVGNNGNQTNGSRSQLSSEGRSKACVNNKVVPVNLPPERAIVDQTTTGSQSPTWAISPKSNTHIDIASNGRQSRPQLTSANSLMASTNGNGNGRDQARMSPNCTERDSPLLHTVPQ